MIDRDHPLPLTDQAKLLNLSRSGLYYVPAPISDADLELMRLIDRLHTDFPFAGARMLRDMLKLRGYRTGRRHVARLMALMGIESAVSQEERDQNQSRTSGLSLPSQKPRYRSPQSGLVRRYLVHPDEARVSLSLRGDGLVLALRRGLASFQHAHDRLLY